jgi:hypothetical protein
VLTLHGPASQIARRMESAERTRSPVDLGSLKLFAGMTNVVSICMQHDAQIVGVVARVMAANAAGSEPDHKPEVIVESIRFYRPGQTSAEHIDLASRVGADVEPDALPLGVEKLKGRPDEPRGTTLQVTLSNPTAYAIELHCVVEATIGSPAHA